MKKTITYIFFISLFIVACRYKDGPDLSLNLPETRIKGYFNLTSMTINNVEYYNAYMDTCGCGIDIGHSATKLTSPIIELTACKGVDTWGNFLFSKNHRLLYIAFDTTTMKGYGPFGSAQNSKWTIMRLTMKDLWIKTNFNNADYFVKLRKKK